MVHLWGSGRLFDLHAPPERLPWCRAHGPQSDHRQTGGRVGVTYTCLRDHVFVSVHTCAGPPECEQLQAKARSSVYLLVARVRRWMAGRLPMRVPVLSVRLRVRGFVYPAPACVRTCGQCLCCHVGSGGTSA